jgi:hypothetical protein
MTITLSFAHDSSVLQGHKSEKVFFSLIGIREGRLKKGGFKRNRKRFE